MPQAPVVALPHPLEIDDERVVALADRADGRVEGEQAHARGASERVDRHRVGEGHRHHGRPLAGEAADHLVEVPRHHVEVAVAPQRVVQPRDDGGEVGLERERRLELLLAHLASELAAHGEVRVHEAVGLARQPLREPIRPAAVAAAVRVGVHQALGGAVPDGDVAGERHACRLENPVRSLDAVTRREIRSWLMDMDGVLVHEEQAIPGAPEFIARLRELGMPFLVLTNNSMYTRRDLAARLARSGLELPEEAIWTSALATARFLDDQRPGGSAFVVGEAGLTTALHGHGYTMTERDPDYVVLGETRTYSFERITRAIRLVAGGARFIATNPDNVGPTLEGPLPATGSVAALISRATGVDPYYVGKPNPLMMRSALNAIDAHSETTAMIGDRMDTDIVSGLEAGLETILVLTGVTTREETERFPFRPSRIVDSVADLVEELG